MKVRALLIQASRDRIHYGPMTSLALSIESDNSILFDGSLISIDGVELCRVNPYESYDMSQ